MTVYIKSFDQIKKEQWAKNFAQKAVWQTDRARGNIIVYHVKLYTEKIGETIAVGPIDKEDFALMKQEYRAKGYKFYAK